MKKLTQLKTNIQTGVWPVVRHLPLTASAFLWRTALLKTRFIAVTGSAGKTTAKDCLGAILRHAGRSTQTVGNFNGRNGIPATILGVRPYHQFAVLETGTDRKGGLVRASLLVRPHVVLVLGVDPMHTDAFRTLDETAAEKVRLLRFMSRRGVAVLNGDDERVAAMAELAPGKVVTFGLRPENDIRASDIRSEWPERLSFTVHVRTESVKVQTRLVGKHWFRSALGAIAAASACGVPLTAAAERITGVEPFSGRLSPEALPNGAVVLRDEFNGSITSFNAAAEVLRDARARRRILVIGDCCDFRKKPRERIKYYAKVAREIAEVVIFVGERCGFGVRRAIREGFDEEAAQGFVTVAEAADWLRPRLGPGDLVLLRGTHAQHMERVYYHLLGTVRCVLESCRIKGMCEVCPELGFTPRPNLLTEIEETSGARPSPV